MEVRFVLSEYVERALEHASYDKLDDGMYSGVIRLSSMTYGGGPGSSGAGSFSSL